MTFNEIKQDVKFWQRLLRLGGYNPGAIDGIVGTNTRAAEARWQAAANLYKQLYGELDERSEGVLATLIPEAQQEMRKWFKRARAAAVELGLTIKFIDGTRTYAEQDKLYVKRPKVTNAKGGYSWHNFGLAADFGLFKGSAYLGDSPHYKTLGALSRPFAKLEWGGDWTSLVDEPHLQYKKFSSLAEARKGF